MEKWYVGQQVKDIYYNKIGTIKRITNGIISLEVKFDDEDICSYTKEGKQYVNESKPSLFPIESQNNWYVGQEVESIIHGNGIITRIDKSDKYPIRINFRNKNYSFEESFTIEGKQNERHLRPVLFPKGQLKIAPIEEKPKFKIGDWVVITKSSENWATEMNKYINRVVQIEEIFVHDKTSITFKNCGTWYWAKEDNHFRPATKEEIPV